MIQTKSDRCVFTNNNNSLFVAKHVHDGLIMAEKEDEITRLIYKLKNKFETVICDNPKQYLGFQIKRKEKENGISLKLEVYLNSN